MKLVNMLIWLILDQYLFLLFQHFVKYWQNPVFKLDIVIVWDQKVSNSVDAFLSEVTSLEREITHVGRGKALDEVFLNSAGSGYDAINLREKNEFFAT